MQAQNTLDHINSALYLLVSSTLMLDDAGDDWMENACNSIEPGHRPLSHKYLNSYITALIHLMGKDKSSN